MSRFGSQLICTSPLLISFCMRVELHRELLVIPPRARGVGQSRCGRRGRRRSARRGSRVRPSRARTARRRHRAATCSGSRSAGLPKPPPPGNSRRMKSPPGTLCRPFGPIGLPETRRHPARRAGAAAVAAARRIVDALEIAQHRDRRAVGAAQLDDLAEPAADIARRRPSPRGTRGGGTSPAPPTRSPRPGSCAPRSGRRSRRARPCRAARRRRRNGRSRC